jgi:hypothetical protein
MRKHLDRVWIGIGLALEWIAMRGQPMLEQDYNNRDDEAATALVDFLADMPPEIAESVVRGTPEEYPGRLGPIPAGIWAQTAAKEPNHGKLPYLLIGVDDYDENEGVIVGRRVSGYRRVQIRAQFIVEHWPETTLATAVAKSRPAAAKAAIRLMIERIIAKTPEELGRLANSEVISIVRRIMPQASRDTVRDLVRDVQHNPKRGPRGERQPDRRQKLQEFGDRLLAAKLQN